MDGHAFIRLALELASSDKEERRRSSVSRAYYGAYHIAREFVRSCGVIVPRRDVHGKLQWCLQRLRESVGDSEIVKSAIALGDLRTDRNRAGHDLDNEIVVKQANVLKAAANARKIVDVLTPARVEAELSRIRPHVRSFAEQQGWSLR